MKCDCGVEMVERVATAEAPYQYILSGLSDVELIGITIRECKKCGKRMPVIPRITELHKVIAHTILLETRLLRGDEIRFLRKNAGISAKEFAALLGIDPSTLSRVEKGGQQLSSSIDKLARIVAGGATHSEEIRKVILIVADQLIANSAGTQKYQLDRTRWKLAA